MGLDTLVKSWLEQGAPDVLRKVAQHTLSHLPEARDLAALEVLQYFGLKTPYSVPERGVLRALSDLDLSLATKRRIVAEISALNATPDSHHKFLVDRDAQFFVHLPSGTQVFSESLSKALVLLGRKHGVSFETLLHVCFGILPYEPLDHDVKIYNLLYRLRKKTFDELEVRTKNRSVYLTLGAEFIFVQRTSFLRHQCLQINSQMAARSWNSISEQAFEKNFFKSGTLTRQQLQTSTGLSKSTSQRILNRLIAKRIVRKIGAGRLAVYMYLPAAIQDSPQIRKESEEPKVNDALEQPKGGENDF